MGSIYPDFSGFEATELPQSTPGMDLSSQQNFTGYPDPPFALHNNDDMNTHMMLPSNTPLTPNYTDRLDFVPGPPPPPMTTHLPNTTTLPGESKDGFICDYEDCRRKGKPLDSMSDLK